MLYPKLNKIKTARQWTEQFLGLDRRPRTYDGAFDAMGNMTGEPWPLLSSRKKRGLVAELDSPQAMAALGKLAWIDGSTLYFNGQATAINDLSLDADMLPKRITAMGAYLLIMPDKRYYNTVDPEDRGGIERLWASRGSVTFTLCDMDGIDYPLSETFLGDRDPLSLANETPGEGDYWLNTGEYPHALYRLYDGKWVSVSSTYVKISGAGIGEGLNVQDGVRISGIEYSGNDAAFGEQLEFLNQTHIIQAVADDFIVITGVIDYRYTQTNGKVRADRRMPQMDYLIECNNRLWGCRFGEQDGETVNRIYACALGDFKNWEKYMGTSMDSYYVNVGSDGPFTGAAVHRGYPHFFKTDCVHKIYGDKPSNFQTQLTECVGVKQGCSGSLAAYNGGLYYVSVNGVEYFESLTENRSKALGLEGVEAAAAGQAGGRYYLSVKCRDGQWDLYVLDLERGVWHRQDDSHAFSFTELNGEMYMLLANGLLYALNGTEGEEEPEDVTWYAETAVMGYEYPDHKYLSRFLLRMRLGAKAECRVYVQYDSDGLWLFKGTIRGEDRVKTYLLPVIPRRCEHLKVRFEGHGFMQLYGMARELAIGRE